MLTLLLSVVLLLVLLHQLYHFVFGKPSRNVPPGIPRLPIWGSYWLLLWGNYIFPHRTIQHYVEKYKSKVVSLWLGDFFTVVATDHKSVKELLKNSKFDGRLGDAYILKERSFGKKLGIFFTDGEQWKEQRKFALKELRTFGFGRRLDTFESDFAEEIRVLIDTLKDGPINDREREIMENGRVRFPDVLYPIATNLILSIITGERVPRQEHVELMNVSRSAAEFQRHTDTMGGAILMTPWLRHIAHGFSFPGFLRSTTEISEFAKNCIKKLKASFAEDVTRGFIDVYLKKLKENDKSPHFTEEQLIMILTDLTLGATTANPWSLTTIIKYMLHNPHVMRKVQKEIDTIVGRDRLVTLDDRVNLPYVDATIREVLRSNCPNPWGIPHRAMEHDKLCGYDIPANTVLIADLHSMHHDREFWGDPQNFRPERFLNDDGSLGKDETLIFSAGGRLCAGETFARQFLFLTFSNLAQNFNFGFVYGEPSDVDDRLPGIVTGPKDLWIKVIPRA